MNKVSYKFKDDKEILGFINFEVKKFIGMWSDETTLYNYNRMTISEISQEVYLKIFKSVNKDINKRYIRTAIMMVCIDLYRKESEVDPIDKLKDSNSDYEDFKEPEVTEEEIYEEYYIDSEMQLFLDRELKIIELLREGYRHPEIIEITKIPKASYYFIINRLKDKYL